MKAPPNKALQLPAPAYAPPDGISIGSASAPSTRSFLPRAQKDNNEES